MARFVVTGGSGFIGRALVAAIRADGDEPIVASRGRHQDFGTEEWIEYDLRDPTTVANIVEAQPDGVYHLAWSTTPGSAEANAAADIQTNLAGSVALFQQLAERLQVPVVFLSSGGTVYGQTDLQRIPEGQPLNPVGIYGMTKAAAESYAQSFRHRWGLDARVVRLANPFGSTQSSAKLQGAASIFARKIVLDEPIVVWGDGSIVRDYIHVDDAVAGLISVIKAAPAPADNSVVYNIGSGRGHSLVELLQSISDIVGRQGRVSFEPARPFDVPLNVLDISKIELHTGWRPRLSLRQALEVVVMDIRRQVRSA